MEDMQCLLFLFTNVQQLVACLGILKNNNKKEGREGKEETGESGEQGGEEGWGTQHLIVRLTPTLIH